MIKQIKITALFLIFLTGIVTTGIATAANNVIAVIETNLGNITLELYPDKAPKSVANFTQYAKDDYYNGTIFHRVIDGFMIQGGGFTVSPSGKFEKKSTRVGIASEAKNGLKNDTGTIAMARSFQRDSATAQFFINVNNNSFLNYTDETSRGWGYAVFGKVTAGMDVVDKIRAISTGAQTPFPKDVPKQTITINKVLIK